MGNLLVKLFGFLVKEPEIQQKIRDEIDSAIGSERPVRIGDRNHLVFTEAVIFEAIRLIASPIVPRVANQSSSIDGMFKISETLIYF